MKWGSSKSIYNPMEMCMYSTESSPGNGRCQVHNDIKSLVSGQIVTSVTRLRKCVDSRVNIVILCCSMMKSQFKAVGMFPPNCQIIETSKLLH